MTHNCWSASCVGSLEPWSRKRDLWRIGFVWTIPLNLMVSSSMNKNAILRVYPILRQIHMISYVHISSGFSFHFALSLVVLAHFQVARTFRASCRPSGAEIPQQWWLVMKTSPTCRVYAKYHDFKGITSSYYILFFRIFMGQNRSEHRPENRKTPEPSSPSSDPRCGSEKFERRA